MVYRSRPLLLLLPVCTAVALAGCGSDKKASDRTVAAAPDTSAAAAPADTAAPEGPTTTVAPDCTIAKLHLVKPGQLTIGTDKPAYDPWFSNDDPTNGKGFESAVAYAIADTMGFTKDQVKWVVVPFNSSFAPGKKDFDFDLNQISITEERKQAVDFSDGYYDVNQAVVALKDGRAANVKSMADLKPFKFGAQVGTTSLDFIKSSIGPSQEPFVYDDTNGAKAALTSKQIDAIVVDLPTAFFISAAEIENSKVVGQFATTGGGEQFGALFEKGNPLVSCVNFAVAELRSTGKLGAIQDTELAQATNAPVFTP